MSESQRSTRFTPLSLLQLRHDTLVNLIEHLSSLHHNYIGMGSYCVKKKRFSNKWTEFRSMALYRLLKSYGVQCNVCGGPR